MLASEDHDRAVVLRVMAVFSWLGSPWLIFSEYAQGYKWADHREVGSSGSTAFPLAAQIGPTANFQMQWGHHALCFLCRKNTLISSKGNDNWGKEKGNEEGLRIGPVTVVLGVNLPECHPAWLFLGDRSFLWISRVHRYSGLSILCLPPRSPHKIIKHLFV